MKKILFLGAAKFQLPPIVYALNKGYTIITADNCPKNPGHKLATRSYNISTVDKIGILKLANEENIDGLLTYGSDVSAPTVNFVRHQLNLSGKENDKNAFEILVNKKNFRKFMALEGFQDFFFKDFSISSKYKIKDFLISKKFPLVIKPVDSSGSKGVSIVDNIHNLTSAIDLAFRSSISKKIIIETFQEKKGMQICGDGFMLDNKLIFTEFGDGHFYNSNSLLAPYAESFPTSQSLEIQQKIRNKLEKVLQLVGYRTGPINFDVFVTNNSEIFINEIGPRNGGNFIPQAITLNTGVDLTKASVEFAIGNDVSLSFKKQPFKNGFFACYMVHSLKKGILKNIFFSDEITQNIFKYTPYLELKSQVSPFISANFAIGHVMLKFDSKREMREKMSKINNYIKSELE